MSHTPGPWAITGFHPTSPNIYYINSISSPASFEIVTVYTHGEPELIANAHLIAAAPELLLACEGALSALILAPHVDKQQAIDYLKEVIAKAKGEKTETELNAPDSPSASGANDRRGPVPIRCN